MKHGLIAELPKRFRPEGFEFVHPNGESLLRCEYINQHTDIHEKHSIPPQEPGRSVFVYSETLDDYIYVREKTDEEHAEAIRSYTQVLDRWLKNSGVERFLGRTDITGRFLTKTGDWVEGAFDGGKWLWTKWPQRS